ncbi:MAG: endonuclease [Phycisphaerae bacterium]
MAEGEQASRYQRIIDRIFVSRHHRGDERVPFSRQDIVEAARALRIELPKNLGDVIYSFRFRTPFPDSVTSRAPAGKSWVIRLAGRAQYCFVATAFTNIVPRRDLAVTKIPDATPGMIDRYALDDEQALLAKLRYNRLIDIFTGATCYSLQSHLRTLAPGMGQVETDEIYIGVDRKGAHYVFPVQAKGGRDKQSIVQIEQDLEICKARFGTATCRPIAAQFMQDGVIALFEFEQQGDEIVIAVEKHYKLVPQKDLSPEELLMYQRRGRLE